MTREAVYYHEQHTMMTQDVTVLINEKILKDTQTVTVWIYENIKLICRGQ